MKKFILPLLFLLAVGMLVAVESDPSAVVGYVKYPCVAGGNTLIALPMEAGFATAGAVGVAVGGGCDAVSIYLPTQAWKTTFDIGDGFEEDFAVTVGTPMQVYTYSAVDFYSIGSLPAPATYSVVTGNNLIMVPLNRSDLTTAGAVGVDMAAGSVDAVSMYLPTQAWQTTFDIGDGFEEDFAISGIGTPLQVYSYTPFTWPSRGSSNGLKTNPNKSK